MVKTRENGAHAHRLSILYYLEETIEGRLHFFEIRLSTLSVCTCLSQETRQRYKVPMDELR